MRYYRLMLVAAAWLTGEGYIVLMPFVVVKTEDQDGAEKAMLDLMHRDKITMADVVIVVGEHIGDSTALEIAFAKSLGKRVLRTTSEAWLNGSH